MSTEKETYVGAFASIKVFKQDVEVKETTCPNGHQLKTPFCPICGLSGEERTKIIQDGPNLYELLEDGGFEDVLFFPMQNEQEIAIGNKINDGCSFNLTDDESVTIINKTDQEKMVTSFTNFYRDVLSYLDNHSLIENITVSFGVVIYWT